jgi:hypothetical protein
MFLTKHDFEDARRILEACDKVETDFDVKIAMAKTLAKELFENFEAMEKTEQKELLDMILKDMSIDLGFYGVN